MKDFLENAGLRGTDVEENRMGTWVAKWGGADDCRLRTPRRKG